MAKPFFTFLSAFNNELHSSARSYLKGSFWPKPATVAGEWRRNQLPTPANAPRQSPSVSRRCKGPRRTGASRGRARRGRMPPVSCGFLLVITACRSQTQTAPHLRLGHPRKVCCEAGGAEANQSFKGVGVRRRRPEDGPAEGLLVEAPVRLLPPVFVVGIQGWAVGQIVLDTPS